MGFGSYDESEQTDRTVDADGDGAVTVHENDHDGDVEFEFDEDGDALIDRLSEMKEDDDEAGD
ncbi:death domain-associated protein [Halobacteriales archaeon QH_7_69_31]|nr:MAG: death domain-associated protein [Halobacteriales archaeon QH_7_69_31]